MRSLALIAPAALLGLLMALMCLASGFFFSGCGQTLTGAPPLLPPNVEQACDKAIACGVVLPTQKPECLACVEKLAQLYDEQKHGALPPLDSIPCPTIAKYAHDTLVSECVVRRSFGP